MYIHCASDRFNYGDLLFPYIVINYFKNIVDKFVVCSTTESDLSSKGALKTEGFHVLQNMSSSSYNILMIAGGECIFCEWKDILGYVREEDESNAEKSYPTRYPFTIAKQELLHLDVLLYNSVGCHQLNEREELYENTQNRAIMATADYVSVRDRATSLGTNRLNIRHYCYPDSAILLSRVFDVAYLQGRTSQTVKEVQRKKYLFFQVGLIHLKHWTKKISEILSRIAYEKNIHLCLCPIGTALGHEDPVALKTVAELLPTEIYTIIESPSVWDIMCLISKTEIYVGSSLHGAITAMSYDRPLIGFGPRKLQTYIETWYETCAEEYSFVSIENLERRVKQRIDNKFTLSAEQQMNFVEQSFKRMRKKICF
ncbi:MAG: polysaccharide pyruvyl transferase family protein [Bacteroidaceae bacterium]|nr:polysaccharide pyruvyl transferase family protein [Bacteroidaceae bacterium]